MRGAATKFQLDPRFELPPRFVVAERRMAGQATDLWRSGGMALVTGFDSNSLVVTNPGGIATIEYAGDAVAGTFGLRAAMQLEGRGGLAAEVQAACDLIVVDPQPIPFEFSLSTAEAGLILARGVALPIGAGGTAAKPGQLPDRVQIIINWREVLDRAATTRLRRELGTSLRLFVPVLAKTDPFCIKPGV